MPELDPNFVIQLCRDFEVAEVRFRAYETDTKLGWSENPPGSGQWSASDALTELVADITTNLLDLCACALEYGIAASNLRWTFDVLVRGDYQNDQHDNSWFDNVWHADVLSEVESIRTEAQIRGRLAWLKRGEDQNGTEEQSPAAIESPLQIDQRNALNILRQMLPANTYFSAPLAMKTLAQARPPVEINDLRTMRKLLDALGPHGVRSALVHGKRRWFIAPPHANAP